MPNQTMRTSFVQDRVDKLIKYVPRYRQWIAEGGQSDSVIQKHFGKGTMRFVGSNARTEFVENPVDIAMADEYDECDMDNMDQLKDRLKASEYKMVRYASRPSYENIGVDFLYKRTCRFRFLSKCGHCGDFREIDWFKHVVCQTDDEGHEFELRKVEDGVPQIECGKCGRAVDQPWVGEWVAEQPGNEKIGYQFGRLISFDTNLKELWDEFQTALGDETKMQFFVNSNLGRAYAPGGNKITEALMERCKGDYLMPSTSTGSFMGVDPGGRHHAFIWEPCEGRKRLVFCGGVRDWASLGLLMEQYNVENCVIDGAYDPTKAKEFRDDFPGRVWLAFYKGNGSLKEWDLDHEHRGVRIGRTQNLDAVLNKVIKFKEDGFLFPANWKQAGNGELKDHFTAPTRFFDEKRGTHVWSKPDAGDHLLHAAGYSLLAEKLPGSASEWSGFITIGGTR